MKLKIGATIVILSLMALSLGARHQTASWYGNELRGHKMANGNPFNPDALTCASWNYPLGTKLKVTHNGKYVIVLVTDRGPAKRLHRDLDLSAAAFKQLDNPKLGLIDINIEKVD